MLAREHDVRNMTTHLVLGRRILGLTGQLDGLFEAHVEDRVGEVRK